MYHNIFWNVNGSVRLRATWTHRGINWKQIPCLPASCVIDAIFLLDEALEQMLLHLWLLLHRQELIRGGVGGGGLPSQLSMSWRLVLDRRQAVNRYSVWGRGIYSFHCKILLLWSSAHFLSSCFSGRALSPCYLEMYLGIHLLSYCSLQYCQENSIEYEKPVQGLSSFWCVSQNDWF